VDATGAIILMVILVVTATHIFQIWARHQRRLMIHRERLAAIEKGVELPPLEQEIQGRSWNVQRLLLLAGLVWISLGLATFPLMARLGGQTFQPPWESGSISVPYGLEWIGVALAGIGVAHIVTFLVGRQRERDELRRS
jgi:hypothetical protein